MVVGRFILFLFASVFLIGTSCTGSMDEGQPISESVRVQALEQLGETLNGPYGWEKIHAAEYLIDLDYLNEVGQIFRQEEKRSNIAPFERIGKWRVLAQLADNPAERTRWVDSISTVYLEASAPDQLHAAETLAKLSHAPTRKPENDHPILNLFVEWSGAFSSPEAETLAVKNFLNIISSAGADPRERRLAAYALRHLGELPAEEWSELTDLALEEQNESEVKTYLLAASQLTVPPDSISSKRLSLISKAIPVSFANKGGFCEIILAMAEKGGEDDIPFLLEVLNGELTSGFNQAEVADIQTTAAYALLRIDRRHEASLEYLDWVVMFLYTGLMLGIGWYYSRKNKTREDYLLGGRNMNPIAVGISLFATLLSTLSYLSYPGEMIQYGPVIFAGMLAFPLVYYVAGWWLIPRIMQHNVTSAYEILEYRLGTEVRMLATFMFLSLRFLWMATIIYVTVDVAFLAVVPIDRSYVPLIGSILMVITIVYTAMGGLKAVVLTDVIQSVIFLSGAFVCILSVSFHFESLTAWFPTQWPAYWSAPRFGFDAQERTTVGNAALMLFVWYICTTGSDQLAIQRYLSTKDIKAARQSLRVSLYTNLLAKILLALVGLAIFAFFTNNQHLLSDGKSLQEQADMLFPRFILLGLPAGLSGLLIAGLLAAAMSSLSSGLNSVSTVISVDVLKKFRKGEKDLKNPLTQVKQLSYVTGALTMILSMFIGNVEGNLFDVVLKVVNLFVGPLFVLFFMALFVPFATSGGALVGGVTSILTAVSIAFFGVLGIQVLWILPLSLFTGVFVGATASYLESLFSKDRKT